MRAQIKASIGSPSVTATISYPAGYVLTGSAGQTKSVGTSDVNFDWSFTAPSSASSSAQMSVSASATNYVTGSNSFGVITVNAASLSGSILTASPNYVKSGGTITVVMTLANAGTAQAIGVAPTTLTKSGAGGATLASGPIPTSVSVGPTQTTITWTYTANTQGSISFSGSASGTDQYSGSNVLTGTLSSNAISIDTVAPVVSITAPVDGHYYKSASLPALAYSATDNLDPNPAFASASTYPLTTGGSHTVTVTYTDAAGNQGSASVTYTVDNTAPATNDDYDGLWHTSNFQITLTATDTGGSGVSATYYIINGGVQKSVGVDGQPQITTESATNTLEYWSVDVASNTETHHTLNNIKLDKTNPSVSITSPTPSETITTATVGVSGTSSDDTSGVLKVEVQVDSGDFHDATGTTSWSYNTDALSDGEHTITARATDNAGNVETTSVTFDINTVVSTSISVQCDPTTVDKSGSHTTMISGNLTSGVSGVEGVSVTLYYQFMSATNGPIGTPSGGTWTELPYAIAPITDSNGAFSYAWDPPESLTNGYYWINATFTGYASYNPSTNTTGLDVAHNLLVVPVMPFGSARARLLNSRKTLF